jgi:hypothetical protein
MKPDLGEYPLFLRPWGQERTSEVTASVIECGKNRPHLKSSFSQPQIPASVALWRQLVVASLQGLHCSLLLNKFEKSEAVTRGTRETLIFTSRAAKVRLLAPVLRLGASSRRLRGDLGKGIHI